MASTIKAYTNASRYTAQRLQKIIEDKYLRGDLISKPLWYDVVRSLPPLGTPRRLPHQDTNIMTALCNSSPESRHQLQNIHNKAVEYCSGLYTHKWEKAYRRRDGRYKRALNEAQKTTIFPRDIEFPEDRLRHRFLTQHPLEQLKPVVMKDRIVQQKRQSPSVEQAMQSMFGDGRQERTESVVDSSMVVDIESAVQYQMRLMEVDGVGEEEAYEKSCQAFYANRVESERRERDLLRRQQQLQAKKTDEDEQEGKPDVAEEHFCPASESWIQKEQQNLE
jgi:hypothetical protein